MKNQKVHMSTNRHTTRDQISQGPVRQVQMKKGHMKKGHMKNNQIQKGNPVNKLTAYDSSRHNERHTKHDNNASTINCNKKLTKLFIGNHRRSNLAHIRYRKYGKNRYYIKLARNHKLKKRKLEEVVQDCSICLSPITTTIFKTSCGHNYHTNCITEWATRKQSCPLCRNDITQDLSLNNIANTHHRETLDDSLLRSHQIYRDFRFANSLERSQMYHYLNSVIYLNTGNSNIDVIHNFDNATDITNHTIPDMATDFNYHYY